MRHGQKISKLQRDASHRKALMANLAVSLITHGRIKTTLAKAKALRPYAEKLVTLGKRSDLHARRRAVSILRQDTAAKRLFDVVAPLMTGRNGGYCRITRLPVRHTDSSEVAFIEWVVLPEDNVKKASTKASETTVGSANTSVAEAAKTAIATAMTEAADETAVEEIPAEEPVAKKPAKKTAKKKETSEEA